MTLLSSTVKQLCSVLVEQDIDFALVGALALGVRGKTRQTVDANFAFSLDSDARARELVDHLILKGFGIGNLYENESSLALAKVFSPEEESFLIELDLIFNLCGIESEVVRSAEKLEIWPGLTIPVASIAALLAMKARCQELSERIQDRADIMNHLLPVATKDQIDEARSFIKLIEDRGFNDGRSILKEFDRLRNQYQTALGL